MYMNSKQVKKKKKADQTLDCPLNGMTATAAVETPKMKKSASKEEKQQSKQENTEQSKFLRPRSVGCRLSQDGADRA